MEVSLRKNSYPCLQSVFSQTTVLSEGQECVVPDTLSDIASIVCTSASPLIRSKDVSDGRVRLEANVPTRITCRGEDGSIFPLDVNLPFYFSTQDEQISGESTCVAHLALRQVDVRMLNPRKISVRAELAVTVTCFEERAVTTFLAPEEGAEALHVMEQSAETDGIVCVTEKTFVLTDEAAIPEQMPAAAEILAQNAAVCVREIKTVGSKVILSGTVNSEVLYRCEAGNLHAFSFQTTFSQIVEADCEAEGASIDAHVLLSGMYYEIIPGSDMREIGMELHLVAQAVISKAQEIAGRLQQSVLPGCAQRDALPGEDREREPDGGERQAFAGDRGGGLRRRVLPRRGGRHRDGGGGRLCPAADRSLLSERGGIPHGGAHGHAKAHAADGAGACRAAYGRRRGGDQRAAGARRRGDPLHGIVSRGVFRAARDPLHRGDRL